MSREMQPWQPFESFTPLRDVMNRLMEESFVWPMRLETAYGRVFPVDVFEDENSYTIEATLPGAKPDELQVNATDNSITIHATVKREDRDPKTGAYVRRERFEGEMTRSVTLSAPIDPSKVTAAYENGVLKLTAPKADVGKPKQVQVQVR